MSTAKLIEQLGQRDFLTELRKACRARHVTLEEVLEKGKSPVVVRAREDCVAILLETGMSLTRAADLLNMEHTGLMAARDRYFARKPEP